MAAEKSTQVLRWLHIMTFLLFLLGQTFLFTEKACQDVAPTIWYYCVVIIILVYVSLVCRDNAYYLSICGLSEADWFSEGMRFCVMTDDPMNLSTMCSTQ